MKAQSDKEGDGCHASRYLSVVRGFVLGRWFLEKTIVVVDLIGSDPGGDHEWNVTW